jgi:cell division protein FtsQ
MVRNLGVTSAPVSGVRLKDKASRRVKRRYDVALNMPGVEMRLPSIPQIRLGWRFASFIMAAFLGVVLYSLANSPMYRVEAAEISGLQNLSYSDVDSVLGVSGKSVFEMDAGQMRQELVEAFPEFSSVSIAVEFPQTVAITVTERVPVIVWQQGGRSKLVDAEGMTFPVRNDLALDSYPVIDAQGDPPALILPESSDSSSEFPQLDVLAGENPLDLPINGKAEQFLSQEMVAAILTISGGAPDGAALVYDPAYGLGWKDQRGWDVYIGDVEDIKMKLSVYDAILEHLKAADTRPTLINVAYVHAPYYRLQQ